MEMSAHITKFKSRNRFLAGFLLLWSVIHFACLVRTAKDELHKELWVSSAFFLGLGSAMTMVFVSMNEVDDFVKFCTMFTLLVGCVLLIATGGIMSRDLCDEADCGVKIFGQQIFVPTLTALIMMMDLHTHFADSARIRITTFSAMIMLCSVLVCGHYYHQPQADLCEEEKFVEAGFLLIVIASAAIMFVIGIANQTNIAVFNGASTFIMYVGLLMLMVSDDMCNSTFAGWYALFCALAFVVVSDAQAGGTIKFEWGYSGLPEAAEHHQVEQDPVPVVLELEPIKTTKKRSFK